MLLQARFAPRGMTSSYVFAICYLLFTSIGCVCNKNGSDASAAGICDPVSGQCSCLKHVVGIQCDKCEAGYWNLASGKGCKPCECDKEGSLEAQCNQVRSKVSIVKTTRVVEGGLSRPS